MTPDLFDPPPVDDGGNDAEHVEPWADLAAHVAEQLADDDDEDDDE